eukprot:4745528-Amphidinium_carterae.1
MAAPRTPPDTPGAMGSMGSQQNLAAVKTEPLSKHEARAAHAKLLTYLKRDVGRGDTQAQAAQAEWSKIIASGDEANRL